MSSVQLRIHAENQIATGLQGMPSKALPNRAGLHCCDKFTLNLSENRKQCAVKTVVLSIIGNDLTSEHDLV